MKNVIFIAPPAAGKGTLSEFLEEKYGYFHISTGDLIRDKIKEQTEEGKLLEQTIQKGNLVDDETIFNLLEEKLKNLDKNHPFILDGIPRTLQQAHKLDIILRDLDFSDYLVIEINVEKEILQKRITGRRICPNCKSSYNVYFEEFKPQQESICDKCGHNLIIRSDDNESAFHIRYNTYLENNEPLLNYYKEQNKLYHVDNVKTENAKEELQRIVGATSD